MNAATSSSVERVEVDSDVGAAGPVERGGDRLGPGPDAVRRDELLLGRIEVAGADERDVVGLHGAGVEQHPQRHSPLVAGRRALDRVQVAVRIEPDDGDPAVASGEGLDRADVRAAAAAEHQRPLGQLESEREALRGERVLLDHRRLGIRKRKRRRLGHRLAASAPGARNPNEARGERSPAGVALVLRPERDRRERPALGALGAQPRQDPETLPTRERARRCPISRSTCMPTLA